MSVAVTVQAPGRARGPAALGSVLLIEVLTGIGTTLLGSMLPALAALWGLDDGRSGTLLLALFAGSASGALLVRAPFHRSLAAGLLLMSASMVALTLCGGHLLFLLMLIFGWGLGLTMTSNSLIVGVQFPRRRAAMLTVLNFAWSVGAAACPFAVQWMIRQRGVRGVFCVLAALAALGIALTLRYIARIAPAVPDFELASTWGGQLLAQEFNSFRIVAFFAIFAMLYCGVECSIGGWVLTYVQRLGFRAASVPPLATSCFWLALLVGRALAPAILLRVREERLLAVSLAGAVFGVLLLLSVRRMPAVLVAASLAGFCLAPIFPICVSILMGLARDAAQARWLFAIAGLGSAGLPWLTGIAAQRTHSLHTGLLVPLATLLIMFLMVRWPRGGVELFRRILSLRSGESLDANALPST